MQAVLEQFGSGLEPGITQSAPQTPEHKQQSPISCFYASLVAARLALGKMMWSERSVISFAEEEGLLSRRGAETSRDFHKQQTEFISRIIGLRVKFIHQHYDEQRIEALTHGLKDRGQPVVFGVKRHWLVLDGLKNTQGSPSWIGMDPASGRRLEATGYELPPAFIAARLVDSGLPLVVVEGLAQPAARFQPAYPKTPRFRGIQN